MRIPFLLCFFALSASGQTLELGFHGGASRLNNSSLGFLPGARPIPRYSLTNGWRFGFRTTLNTWRYFGQEIGYGYNRTQLREETSATQNGMAIHQGSYNLLAYATREGSKIRPFAAGGGHFNSYTPPGTSVTSGGANTKFGFNYGGGVKVKVSPIFAIRLDMRYYRNGKPFDFLEGRSGLIGQLELSMGFSLVI
ncbi:MAG: outer membrane beta-barrel protein [Acidobacteria bacterium]|nr:outer membrane beta-barrel protein [Acidobacteriota bacterium]